MSRIIGNRRAVAIAAAPFILLLLSGAQAFAAQGSQQLAFSMNGAIVTSGTQIYTNSGGNVVSASILGNAITLTNAKLQFSVNALVTGIKTSGTATINLDGSEVTPTGQSQSVHVNGFVRIQSMLSAEPFPLGCGAPGTVPAAPCTSAVAAFYLGTGTFTITQGRSTQFVTLPMMFESAFLNPFGGPLVFVSTDSPTSPSIFIVTTYNSANIIWSGVQLAGTVTGTGSTSATGSFLLTTGATENLMAGTEKEVGTWVFSQMTPTSLDTNGFFFGNSTIPAAGPGSDCSSLTGVEGTCNLTGFISTGQFTTRTGANQALDGSYTTNWGTPAVTFSSTVTATLGQGQGQQGQQGER